MRMGKLAVAAVCGSFLLLGVMSVSAQDSLSLDTPATVMLDAANPEASFTYAGTEGELIVITYKYTSDDIFSDPLFGFTDPDGDLLVDPTQFNLSPIILKLQSTGEYAITLAQPDADTEGEAVLTITNPAELVLDAAVQGERETEQRNYFYYEGDDNFNIEYAQEGELPFEVTVNTFSEFSVGFVTPLATVSGEIGSSGMIGNIPGGELYIIILGEPFFFSFDVQSASYSLGLTKVE